MTEIAHGPHQALATSGGGCSLGSPTKNHSDQIPSAGGAGPPCPCGLDILQPHCDSVCCCGDAACFRGNGGKPDGILDAAVSRSTVTRDDLAHAIYARIPGLSRADAKALLDCALEEMLSALTSGEDVSLRGFGTFRIRSKNARPRPQSENRRRALSSRRVGSSCSKRLPHLKSAMAASGAPRVRRQLSVERSPARRGGAPSTADVANRAPPAPDAAPNRFGGDRFHSRTLRRRFAFVAEAQSCPRN